MLPNWAAPPALVVQVTVPVGTVLMVAASVTVAVHVCVLSTTRLVRVQETAVVVFALMMLNALLVVSVKPALEALSV